MLFPVFLAILIFLFGSKVIYAAENTEKEADRVQEALFEEFDFSKLDQEMKTLFPDEKLCAYDVSAGLNPKYVFERKKYK